MDWDRFTANEYIGECRIKLEEVARIAREHEPICLQIVDANRSSNIVGKDLCDATLWITFSILESNDAAPGCKRAHDPERLSTNHARVISSEAQDTAKGATRQDLYPPSASEDACGHQGSPRATPDGRKDAHQTPTDARESFVHDHAAAFALQLGGCTLSSTSPRNIFDELLQNGKSI